MSNQKVVKELDNIWLLLGEIKEATLNLKYNISNENVFEAELEKSQQTQRKTMLHIVKLREMLNNN